MDDLLAAEQKVTDLRRQLERMDRDIRQHVDEESTLRRALQRASQLKARSEDERDQSTTDNGRLAGLETLLEESKAEFEIQENAYGAAVNNKDRLNDLAAGLKVEVDAVDERLRGAETELMRARKGYDQAFTARTKALQAKNRAVLDANEVRNKIRALADRVEDQRNTIEQYKGEAGKICLRVRIPPGETSESLDAKIVALDQEMQRFISE